MLTFGICVTLKVLLEEVYSRAGGQGGVRGVLFRTARRVSD